MELKQNDYITLVSSVVVPQFCRCCIHLEPVHGQISLRRLLRQVKSNFHGHEATVVSLRRIEANLPRSDKSSRWDGQGYALAIRPKGGLRGSKNVDKEIDLEDLEAILYWIERV